MANYEKDLREAQRLFLQAIYPEDYKKLKKVAKKLSMEFERARQARQYGKGSAITINGLILMGLDVNPKDIKRHMPTLRKTFATPSSLSILDELIEEARSYYGENDLIAWLRLLIARYEIEIEIGLRKKPLSKSKK